MRDFRIGGPPPSKAEDKAARTTRAANEIMDKERAASDAKVARLKALREAASPVEAPAPVARPRRKKAVPTRSLALQGGMPAKNPA